MKTIKLEPEVLTIISSKRIKALYLINDDQDINLDDIVELVDSKTSKTEFRAKITQTIVKKTSGINDNDLLSFPELEEELKDLKDSDQIKIIFFDYLAGEQEGIPANLETTTIKMFTDGGSRGNPGPSASGYVLLTTEDEIIVKKGIYLGITTNNQAEYKALLFGLQEAVNLGASNVYVYMDSLLIVNQMKGVYKIKNRDLIPIHNQINEIVSKFKKVTFTHVPREFNKLADKEVNDCLDSSH